MPFARLAAVALAFAAATASAGQSGPPAELFGWIQRMNKVLIEGNFDGVLERRSDEGRQELRIVHRFKDGEMMERVVARDGSGYEQRRKGDQFSEYFPKRRIVIKSIRTRSFGYIQTLNGLDAESARLYDISDAGRTRLLGRDVQMIRIEPKDDLRLGYRLWLETGSAMPLKLQRVTRSGAVVKEIAFTFINVPLLPADIPDEQLRVDVDFSTFKGYDRDKGMPFYDARLKRALLPQMSLMPAGYRIWRFGGQTAGARSPQPRTTGPRSRFIVSDGVTWAEVFLAPASTDTKEGGDTFDGGNSGYQMVTDGVRVSVVGELPLAAAEAIAKAFRPE
ncbi:MAG: MucB/RseB C-terminal domain-containing protein [Pseudomonadota bacterium]|nr:MucB/RseB C-terminal domain-containing protein [Pseudomonadota bacterium]